MAYILYIRILISGYPIYIYITAAINLHSLYYLHTMQELISKAELVMTQRQRDHTCACGEFNFIILDILYCSLCPSIYSGRLMIFQWLNTHTNYAQCFVRVPP